MQTRTTTQMLDELADPANQEVWEAFDARFRPVLNGFARRLGLSAEDAADAAQEALIRFVGAYRDGKYERGRGRLSSWILGIARNCIVDQARTRATRREARGMSAVVDLPGEDRLGQLWAEARDSELIASAVRRLRATSNFDPRTIEAFELLAFKQLSPSEVSEQLEMSPNDVYLAKHRCLKRIRAMVAQLSVAFEADA